MGRKVIKIVIGIPLRKLGKKERTMNEIINCRGIYE